MSDLVVFDRTVHEAVRRTKIAVANDAAFVGGAAFIADGVGAVTRTVLSKLRDRIDAEDYGVVGDGVADDTAAVQLALDAGADQDKVVHFTSLTPLISGPLTCDGPGLVFDPVSHGDSGGPGFLLTGTGYVGMTVTGAPQLFVASFYGTGNTMDGVVFQNPQRALVQHVRVFGLDGFGVSINKCYDCVFDTISVEQCGNTLSYAFSMNDDGDTCNQTHVMRLQVEKANQRAIFISPNTLNCQIDVVHSEQATVVAIDATGIVSGDWYRIAALGTTDFTTCGAVLNSVSEVFQSYAIPAGTGTVFPVTWHFGGARSTYNGVEVHANPTDTNATVLFNSVNCKCTTYLQVGGITTAVNVASSGSSFALENAEIQGTLKPVTNQPGQIVIANSVIAGTLNLTQCTRFKVYSTKVATLTVGFSDTIPDATLAIFVACDIAVLISSSTLSAATFIGCDLAEGNNLLRGKTVLIGSTVSCAATLVHSSGTMEVRDSAVNATISYTNHAAVRGYGAIFNGGISCGDAGLADIVFDYGTSAIGTVTGVGIPTAGAHTIGERHKNVRPTSASDLGWVCTVSATPGTWISDAPAGSGTTTHALTAGTHLSMGGTFDGSVARTMATDATSANTASTIMARDGSGNVAVTKMTGDLDAAIVNVSNKIVMGAGDDVFLGNSFAADALIVATGYLTIKDVGGTKYDLLVRPH